MRTFFDDELLIEAKKGDQNAIGILLNNNKGLVHMCAGRFAGRGVEQEDLIQLGFIGLYKAIINFDSSYEVKFSTYAVPLVMGEIKRFLRENGSIKVSRRLKELYAGIKFTKSKLELTLGREPKITEIAEAMNVGTEDIILSLNANERVFSLEEELNGEDKNTSLIETIEDISYSEEKIVDRIVVNELIQNLKKNERQIIILRFFKELTQQEIADMLGISQVQVCRILKRVLKKLKDVYKQ